MLHIREVFYCSLYSGITIARIDIIRIIRTFIKLWPDLLDHYIFRLKIVKEDEVAEKFLTILNRDGSEQYILKKDLENSEFGHLESLNLLIADLVNNGVPTDVNDRFIINGKVLNSAHIIDDNSDSI